MTEAQFIICEVDDNGDPRSSISACLIVSRYITEDAAIRAAEMYSRFTDNQQRKCAAFRLESVTWPTL